MFAHCWRLRNFSSNSLLKGLPYLIGEINKLNFVAFNFWSEQIDIDSFFFLYCRMKGTKLLGKDSLNILFYIVVFMSLFCSPLHESDIENEAV